MPNPGYQGRTTCLNEGQADAMSVLIGTIPEGHLGPVHLSGINFTNNCQSVTEVHDVGNCYFWHLKQAGVLDIRNRWTTHVECKENRVCLVRIPG